MTELDFDAPSTAPLPSAQPPMPVAEGHRLSRRAACGLLAQVGAGLVGAAACERSAGTAGAPAAPQQSESSAGVAMPAKDAAWRHPVATAVPARVEAPSLEWLSLGAMWPTFDPFLFCVHHDDAYPKGARGLGPDAALSGRQLGQDFSRREGWSMYHGHTVPGFPRHPHRGFETVTIVRRGFVDHTDSLGARARYGAGDVQWLTAGRGIVHAEMFPLLETQNPNPLDLFQIWLNLPRASKFVEPHFSMFWRERMPVATLADAAGRQARVTVVAGDLPAEAGAGLRALAPPPDSWAARSQASVAIWVISLPSGGTLSLPEVAAGVERTLYFVRGGRVLLGVPGGGDPGADGGKSLGVLESQRAVRVRTPGALTLEDSGLGAEVLLLQGRPIGEPVARSGPFVMNERQELVAAYQDYQRTEFGGWPWPAVDPVHGERAERFAAHPGGPVETL